MKAKIFFEGRDGKHQRTIEVESRNVNEIIAEFVKATGVSRGTYVSHIKVGRYDYQWNGNCWGAYPC